MTLRFQLKVSGASYFSSIVITYDDAAGSSPSFTASDVNIAYNATGGSIAFTVNNEVDGGTISASTEDDWLTLGGETTSPISFTCSSNESVVSRTATVTLTYTYDTDKTASKNVTVTQVANPALGTSTLPYTIAQAKTKIDSGSDLADKYVHGIISQIDSYNSNTITYWISDDGTTANQFEVYKGKGLNNANFTAVTDLELGDIVTVYGTLTLYNKTTYEFATGNYITSLERKEESDLALTSSTPVALKITSAEPNPTSAITWTTSSEGAISFVSSDTDVATVTSAGVITAVGEGSATITITQAADETYKASDEKTVTVNVTDNRSACAMGIDLTSAKTITKGATDDLTASSTKTDGFTGTITYSYVSADASILNISDGKYTGAGVGATTVTVTATPTGGNAANYKPASQEVAVTVNGANSISLDPATKNVPFSASTFNIAATVPTENYDGAVSAVSSNTSVATVSVDGTTITVTPVAVGTATITVTAGTGTYYPATAQAECSIELTQPAGGTTAPSGVTTTFKNKDLEFDGAGLVWSASTSANSFESSGSSRGVQFGAAVGNFTLTAVNTETISKVSMIVSTNGDASSNTIAISVGSSDFKTTVNDAEVTSFSMPKANNQTVDFSGTGTGNIVISVNDVSKSVYFKSITVTKAVNLSVKLNASGFATYCSQYPLDFTSTEGYTAWQITNVSGETITFGQITGKVKGGTGILLMGEAGATVTLTSADSEETLGSNKLEGTLAPTYVSADQYYGLKGNEFVPVTAGTVPAGKALLPASEVPASVRGLSFVFDNADGIVEMRKGENETMRSEVFDLSGRRVVKPTKGLYIVNGKKIMVK